MTETNPTMSWEDRVVALEVERDNLKAKLEEQVAERAIFAANVEALTAQLDAYRAAEERRKAEAAEAYIGEIKAEACSAGHPIPEADLELVAEALSRGDERMARAMGDAFLSRSIALSGVAADETKTIDLNPASALDAETDALLADFRARREQKKKGA